MDRLSVVDEIFLRTHRGMGTPIALQGLWRTADLVDRALLDQVHAALRVGPLGRRVIRPRVPGARRAWQRTVRAHPLAYTADPIPVAALLDWADSQGGDLDPEFGPGWRLTAAPLADGGTVIALTCSHALADGRGLIHAVAAALAAAFGDTPAERYRHGDNSGHRPEPRPDTARDRRGNDSGHRSEPRPDTARDRRGDDSGHRSEPRADTRRDGGAGSNLVARDDTRRSGESDRRIPARGTVSALGAGRAAHASSSDWVDARRQWSIVLRGTVRALRRGIPQRPITGEVGSARKPHSRSVILRFAAEQWDRIAADQGGTANSLFIWFTAQLLWASGFAGDVIEASLPVDTREEPRTDNDLAVTSIEVRRADDPASIREKSRAAYEYRMSSPGGMPEELLQVIPDRWAYALSRGAGERDILCSNIGALPMTLERLGPHHCAGVAARAIHPGLQQPSRTRLSAYLCRIGGDYTLALVTPDPDIDLGAAIETVPLPIRPTLWQHLT
ncbi:hypothetical protein ACFVMC_07630 [Nocardia sp. NPDC127579]|uniref:hypothetical protein n=1 Tax=Nocardia sp. NPDC127579 TaxID=3345402 RepID=UPI00363CD158